MKTRTDVVGQFYWTYDPTRMCKIRGTDILDPSEPFTDEMVAVKIRLLARSLQDDSHQRVQTYQEDGIWTIEITKEQIR